MSGAGAPDLQVDGTGMYVTIVAASWHTVVMDGLLAGARRALHAAGVSEIREVRVPGSFELPIAASRAAHHRADAIVALGVIIRGGTPHFEYVAAEATKGVGHVAMEAPCAVAMGILTCDTLEQALERAGVKAGNKGSEAALAAIEQANVFKAAEKAGRARSQ